MTKIKAKSLLNRISGMDFSWFVFLLFLGRKNNSLLL